MIITNLPYMVVISDSSKIQGASRNQYFDNRAGSLGYAYADAGDYENFELKAATQTSVYIEPGLSEAQSSSEAEAHSIVTTIT